jgi:hypothetical protein
MSESQPVFHRLFGALRAAETLNVCNDGPSLNRRGVRVLRYLEARRHREARRREADA